MNKSLKDLLSKTSSQLINPSKFKELEMAIKMCDAISNLNNQSVYLIDYVRQKLAYVSPHPLFLCGYKVEEAMEMGYAFIEKIIPPDDLQMIVELHRMSWNFIYSLAPEDRAHIRISYDIHFRHKNGNKILVNQKVAPLLFTDDDQLWINMCIVNHSPHKEAGNAVFMQKNKNLYYNYDFNKKKFVAYIPDKLTTREEEILRLSMQGYNEVGIADKLNISIVTVRNHRHNAEKKLGVNNMPNAVGMFNLIF